MQTLTLGLVVVTDRDVAIVAPPVDAEVRKVADKLASFVAKNGRQFENITRQKNPGDTPFRYFQIFFSKHALLLSGDLRDSRRRA